MRGALALVLIASMAPAGKAAESKAAVSPRATVTLISDTDAVEAGQAFRVGLLFRLAPGWHTYWRNPGEAGAAPELTFDLPTGASVGPIAWPAPTLTREGPVTTYAYTGDVLLSAAVTPGPGANRITVQANWLVCDKICVPEEGTFTLDLPQGAPSPSAQASLFARADGRVPRQSPFKATIARNGMLSISGAGLDPGSVTEARFFPVTEGVVDPAAPQILSARPEGFSLRLKTGKPVDVLTGVLEVHDRTGSVMWLDVAAGPSPALNTAPQGLGPVASPDPGSLAGLLLFAALGGLILNLMPCVFPVLAIKAVAIAGARDHRDVRVHALYYTAGVLSAFAALGAALLAARSAGSVAGWGFQFQSPVFVAAMAWLMFAVGLNLSGVFEIGGELTGVGQALASRRGHAGSFFTGLLAVLVATPCTAPFMGVAIAAALAAQPARAILIFLAMGVGLALPYLLLALLPGLARMVPRPGRWMLLLRQGLAFPMYAASAWLIWVVSQQSGPSGVLACLAGLVLIGFAAWVGGMARGFAGRGRRAAQTMAAMALLAAVAMLTGLRPEESTPGQVAEAGVERFSMERLAELRAEGRPVFVNMTAAWCVTCIVNERVVLSNNAVRSAFESGRVVYMKGDWTRQDPEITGFLRAQGRDGVPLYAFFRAGAAQPVILPQILTEGAVLETLRGAGA